MQAQASSSGPKRNIFLAPQIKAKVHNDPNRIVKDPLATGNNTTNDHLKPMPEEGKDEPKNTYEMINKLCRKDRSDKEPTLYENDELIEHFHEFLAKMEKFNLLPTWWSEEHVKACEEMGGNWKWGINDKEGGFDNGSIMGREIERNVVTINLETGSMRRGPSE